MDWEDTKKIAGNVGRFAGKAALFLGKGALAVGVGVCKELISQGQKYGDAKNCASTKSDSELFSDIKSSDITKKTAAFSTLKDRGYSADDIKDKYNS